MLEDGGQGVRSRARGASRRDSRFGAIPLYVMTAKEKLRERIETLSEEEAGEAQCAYLT
jgi:hypothetical protein